jgi:hypothetical protein
MLDVMTSDRERAMAALRTWSAPGVRAQLIAAAWRAGETSISALADAANVSRPTVYTDLESCGINPRTDRTEKPPAMQTITVGPFTGTESNHQRDILAQDLLRRIDAMPKSPERTRLVGEALERHHHEFGVARYHNGLLPYVARAAEARENAQRALHVVESRWDALRTARAWLAAHHSYVEAVATARTAIRAWGEATAECATQQRKLTSGWLTPDVYDQYVPAGQQLVVIDDTDAAALAATELEETYTSRRAIVRETLTLGEVTEP